MESGSKKRPREMCWREKKCLELGDEEIKKRLRGTNGYDEEAADKRRLFPFAKEYPDKAFDHVVPGRLQMWRKKMSSTYLKILERKKREIAREKRQLSQEEEEEEVIEDKSDLMNLSDFINLDQMEKVKTKEFRRDMVRYARDEKKSDGFDVGFYPYRDAAGICGFVFRYYNPPEANLPKAHSNTLLHLSKLAVSVYNIHQQLHPTDYDNVQVLKAMNFGPYSTNLNITFQASVPPLTFQFQTTVHDRSYPPDVPYSSFEIVLVRKIKGKQEEEEEEDASDHKDLETDYVTVQGLPKFPSSMEKLTDFDEKEPPELNINLEDVISSLSIVRLPFYLCEFALHQYIISLHRYDRDHDEDDEIYDTVKVLSVINILSSSDEEHGTTYHITFQASLLDDKGNPQVFETKLFMSPLIPTTRIKIKFIRIKGK